MSTSAAPVKVNRTVPKVEPPKAALEFSPKPTVQEIFRARIFEEPLIPIGSEPTPAENAALAAALLAYSKRSGPDDFSSLTDFLRAHPLSPWTASLLTSLGLEYYNTGHYSKIIEVWARAWSLSKDATEPRAKAVADRAVGELAYMYARLGRQQELQALLDSVKQRTFAGSATERITGAQEGLWTMKNTPEVAFRCGPFSLDRIRATQDPKTAGHSLIRESKSTPNGFSLPQVSQLSRDLKMDYQMAFREKGAPIVTPAVVHWKAGHYAGMVRQANGRFLIQDPTFGNDLWITQAALEDEASGYFLLPQGSLPTGWRSVDEAEGQAVWGKGSTSDNDPKDYTPEDPKVPNECPSRGMAVAHVHLMLVSLNITDTPVGHRPPVGPPVAFKVTYNQREAYQPATFTYSNLGQKWTFDWLSFIQDNPTSPDADVQHYVQGGGARASTGYNPGTQTYAPQVRGQALLLRTSSSSYELQSRDGSKKIFSQSDGATGTSRKIFLKRVVDPAGNFVELTYDASLRIVAITDAIGQVTTLSYTHPTDIFKITRVTDPFGRFATFEYDASDRLFKITDTLGLVSQFTYDAGDFITAMTTPYGTTTFVKGGIGRTRTLETTDPAGDTERVEYNQDQDGKIPFSEPWATVPQGMDTNNFYLTFRNTYYWDKAAFAKARNDYTKARLYHWLHSTDTTKTSGVLESIKLPFENRVWYNYAGALGVSWLNLTDQPGKIGRVLDDGQTQTQQYQYNSLGNLTQTIDPIGRTISYVYDANGVDLLEVRQTAAGSNELLSQMTYNGQHRPLSVTDASGQTTINTYNVRGQVLTTTNAKSETTTLVYDASGYLTSVDGPLPGTSDQSTFTYDGYGRVRTTTGVDGYTLTYDYDVMDRVTRVTFPDTTFQQYTYDRLDRSVSRDRLGRETLYGYNSLRQLVREEDPLHRVTQFEWCRCGDLRKLIDPLNRATTWRHDVQGRPTAKEYVDGSKITYNYENTTSRLKRKVDEKGQFTDYQYYLDDTLQQISYPNATVPTPTVSYIYDPLYRRVTSMADGIGDTNYAYNPVTVPPALGVNKLASVDGPLANDTVAYQYDELGRTVSRTINGVSATTAFDALGRPFAVTNPLGSFSYTYDGATRRLASVSYPNGQSSAYTYFGNLGDHRLQQISHVRGATPISQFGYTYNPVGNILSWSQQAGADPAKSYSFGYDVADQLTSAILSQGATTVKSYGYTYDPASNRITEQIDGVTRQSVYNALNELTTTSNESDPAATYEWDGVNRLVAIVQGANRREFTYDGLSRRVRIVEKQNGSIVSDRRVLWCGTQMCEERDPTGGTVLKRYFPRGMKIAAGSSVGNYYYTPDHLGSVREAIDSAGQIRARYDYDSYGRQTKLGGDVDCDFGFTHLPSVTSSGLFMALYRYYDSETGRWMNRDPIAERGGTNLYAYVSNMPVQFVDRSGLTGWSDVGWDLGLLGGGFEAAAGTGLAAAVAAGVTAPAWVPIAGAIGAGFIVAGAAAALTSFANRAGLIDDYPEAVTCSFPAPTGPFRPDEPGYSPDVPGSGARIPSGGGMCPPAPVPCGVPH